MAPLQQGAGKASVDVIIPVLDGEKYIGQALESVLRQTFPVNRIIVIDDGSTDRTNEVVSSIKASSPVAIDYVWQENRGLSAARNRGIELATADFVAFLDADDEWLETKLQQQMAIFEASRYPNLGLVYCAYLLMDERGQTLTDAYVLKPHDDLRGQILEKLLKRNLVTGSGSGVLVRRGCFADAGLFDVRLTASEDWDMWLRLAERYDFDFCPEPLVRIRRHGGNMQKDLRRMFDNEVQLYGLWADRLPETVTLPSSWWTNLAKKMYRELPATVMLHLAEQRLTTKARRRIFRASGGSLWLAVAMMALPASLEDVVRWLRRRLNLGKTGY